MFYAFTWPDCPFDPEYTYFCYATREAAEKAAEVHKEHGDEPEIIEVAGTLILPTKYMEPKRIVHP
jgi:hypothetical protein